MSGLLLPGTAGPAQVLSGYTASGAAGGLGFAGSAIAATTGSIADFATANVLGTAETSWVCTFATTPKNSDSVILEIYTESSVLPSSVSGLGATWTQVTEVNSNLAQIWLGTGLTGVGNTVTINFGAAELGIVYAQRITGSLAPDSVVAVAANASTTINLTVPSVPAGGLIAVGLTTAGTQDGLIVPMVTFATGAQFGVNAAFTGAVLINQPAGTNVLVAGGNALADTMTDGLAASFSVS